MNQTFRNCNGDPSINYQPKIDWLLSAYTFQFQRITRDSKNGMGDKNNTALYNRCVGRSDFFQNELLWFA